jgi:hypothetical protein
VRANSAKCSQSAEIAVDNSLYFHGKHQAACLRLVRIRTQTGSTAMDYDVHLFTDAATGEDAVVYRAGPSGLRLARSAACIRPDGRGRRPLPSRRRP